jgi:macrodomain Ter protein organizer (MatP/YcbG family)
VKKKIKLDPALYKKLAQTAKERGYASTDEFIVHVLEQAVSNDASPRDDEEIKKQLRGLGYIE